MTLKLYVVLWLLFVCSVFLNGPQFFTLVGEWEFSLSCKELKHGKIKVFLMAR